nr:hypothetical protein GCM10020093_096360 [Planobispora longispora]
MAVEDPARPGVSQTGADLAEGVGDEPVGQVGKDLREAVAGEPRELGPRLLDPSLLGTAEVDQGQAAQDPPGPLAGTEGEELLGQGQRLRRAPLPPQPQEAEGLAAQPRVTAAERPSG